MDIMNYNEYITYLKKDLQEWEYVTLFTIALNRLCDLGTLKQWDILKDSSNSELRNDLVLTWLANIEYSNK